MAVGGCGSGQGPADPLLCHGLPDGEPAVKRSVPPWVVEFGFETSCPVVEVLPRTIEIAQIGAGDRRAVVTAFVAVRSVDSVFACPPPRRPSVVRGRGVCVVRRRCSAFSGSA